MAAEALRLLEGELSPTSSAITVDAIGMWAPAAAAAGLSSQSQAVEKCFCYSLKSSSCCFDRDDHRQHPFEPGRMFCGRGQE